MTNEMRVKIVKRFLSPLTGRMTKVGEELNVPMNKFWLKRKRLGDCEKIKFKSKIKAPSQPMKTKGSK